MDIDRHGPVPTASDSDSDPDHVVCPECGSEFQPHVTHCIDCGAATVAPGAAATASRAEPAPLPAARDDEAVSIRAADLEWIEDLQVLFGRHDIASRVVPIAGTRQPNSFEIFVAKEDARRAYQLDREFFRQRIDDDDIDLTEVPPPGICPYCGAEVPADRTDCPHCGLVLAFNNLEIVQSLYHAFAEQDREQILAIFDPGIEWIQSAGFPGGGRYAGAEAVMDGVFGRLGREWEGWRAEVGRWLDAGESIVALGEYHGTNRATGRAMTAAFAHVLWLREGRVVRFEQYADTATVAAACPALSQPCMNARARNSAG
jgi:ketosteroid isomerase-like protein